MRTALGLKAHSGWAALVALAGGPRLVERARVELADEPWQKAPYHAAEKLPAAEARALVENGVAAVREAALREVRALVKRHGAAACGIVWGAGMPEWSTDEILAVHFRMHKAEGELFREALARAAEECGVRVVRVPLRELGAPPAQVAALGEVAGPPWGKDQKEAAHAAWLALQR